MALNAKDASQLPLEMLTEIALAIEPGDVIAARYGFNAQDYQTLSIQPWFARAIRERQEEIVTTGVTFKTKAKLVAEELLGKVFQNAINGASPDYALDVLKYTAKLAELEPKANAVTNTGTGFSITINIPQQLNATPVDVIDIKPENPNDGLGDKDELRRVFNKLPGTSPQSASISPAPAAGEGDPA